MTEVLIKDGRALKHVQVREYVRALVSGMSPGSPAPSERELVAQFGVARMTVRQAMDALVVEGLLERIPGKGTFVARPRRTASTITSYSEEIARRGMLGDSVTLLARREQAGPGVARALNVTEGDPVIHWKRLRRADGGPMCIEDAFLNEVLLPGFLQSGMPTSLYDALEQRGLRPTWAEDSINADVCQADEATHLEVAAGDPVLRHSRRALNGDKVVEVSRSRLPCRPLHPLGADRPGLLDTPASFGPGPRRTARCARGFAVRRGHRADRGARSLRPQNRVASLPRSHGGLGLGPPLVELVETPAACAGTRPSAFAADISTGSMSGGRVPFPADGLSVPG